LFVGPRVQFAGAEAVPRVAGELGFHTDHGDLRAQRLHRGGHPGDQSAASHRGQDDLDVGYVFDDLQPDGALPGDHVRVVVRRDHGQAA